MSAHAYEQDGVNTIPEALAEIIGKHLHWPVDSGVVQTNIVAHTGAGGFERLARQPIFTGEIRPQNYIMVDDFIGMGGTLANLKGYIEANGGRVLAAIVLTGKARSARLKISSEQLQNLRGKHGSDIERWWNEKFGHSFDALTESEAGYLFRTPDVAAIRDRITAVQQAGDRGGDGDASQSR